MNSRKIQRINLSLYLNPLDSVADQRAVNTLRDWHDGKKQGDYSRHDVNMEIRAFHRNIYLAGLQLYLMSPQTCNYVAESLGRDAFTLNELIAELSGTHSTVEAVEAVSQDFSDAQLHQLKRVLKDSLKGEIQLLHTVIEKQTRQIEALRQPASIPVMESSPRGNAVEEHDLNNEVVAPAKLKKVREKGIF